MTGPIAFVGGPCNGMAVSLVPPGKTVMYCLRGKRGLERHIYIYAKKHIGDHEWVYLKHAGKEKQRAR